MSMGTSLAEAYMTDDQIDPHTVFDYSTEPTGVYDPQEASRQFSANKKKCGSGLPSQKNINPVEQPQQYIQTNVANMANLGNQGTLGNQGNHGNLGTLGNSNTYIENQNGNGNGNGIEYQPNESQVVINPVREYPPYEYDASAVLQQFEQKNLKRKLEDIQKAKAIEQRQKRVENFSDDKGEHPSKKRNDVFKSILFTLMILLAISTHYIVAFIFEHFVTATGQYSLRQELGFRLIYPVIILGIIWWAKS